MKAFVKLLLLAGLVIYLIFALTNFCQSEDRTVCRQVNFTIADSTHAGFITAEEADNLLRKSGAYPIGRQMSKVNGIDIERALKKSSFIDSASCYKAPNGVVNVLILQRLPLLRIMAENGDDYYIDDKGHIMNPQGYSADLPVVTGHITQKEAQRLLIPMGSFLRNDAFWNDQIEQIHVEANHHVTLVPRVGNHLIRFGQTDSISTKFRNLYTFYEKVLPQVGWNKYTEISVEHVTQIVGKKSRPGKQS